MGFLLLADLPQVVLIGDGFAEGLGDWVVMGGMAGATRQLERQAGTDENVSVGVITGLLWACTRVIVMATRRSVVVLLA